MAFGGWRFVSMTKKSWWAFEFLALLVLGVGAYLSSIPGSSDRKGEISLGDTVVKNLGWRDVAFCSKFTPEGIGIVGFGINTELPPSATGNTRLAVVDYSSTEPASGHVPLISKDRGKAFIVEIQPSPDLLLGLSGGPVYVVKTGNLTAELVQAGL